MCEQKKKYIALGWQNTRFASDFCKCRIHKWLMFRCHSMHWSIICVYWQHNLGSVQCFLVVAGAVYYKCVCFISSSHLSLISLLARRYRYETVYRLLSENCAMHLNAHDSFWLCVYFIWLSCSNSTMLIRASKAKRAFQENINNNWAFDRNEVVRNKQMKKSISSSFCLVKSSTIYTYKWNGKVEKLKEIISWG